MSGLSSGYFHYKTANLTYEQRSLENLGKRNLCKVMFKNLQCTVDSVIAETFREFLGGRR